MRPGLCLLLVVMTAPSRAQVMDAFTDGDFTANPAWTGEAARFRVVARGGNPALNTDGLARNDTLHLVTPSAVTVGTWRFRFVWENVNLSTSNGTRVFLVADTPAVEGPVRGYFVQIGANNDDAVRLVRQDGEDATRTTLGQSAAGLVAGDNGDIVVEVVRDAAGAWTVRVGGQTVATATDARYMAGTHFGIWVKHSTTTGRAFYFDDVFVTGTAGPPDATPPRVLSAEEIGSETVLTFDEPLDPASVTPAAFATETGVRPASVVLGAGNMTVRLALTGARSIIVTGLRDRQGNAMARTDVAVAGLPTPGALAFSEILAAPRTTSDGTRPVQTEFVEILNRSDRPVSLRTLLLTARSSGSTTTDTTRFDDAVRVLPPGGFLVLYDNDPSDGPDVATQSRLALAFPSANLRAPGVVLVGRSTVTSGGLTNAGECLQLLTTAGTALTPLTCYSDRWAAPDRRTAFSLERFDFSREGPLAWAASESPEGATPGGPSSVQPVAGAQSAQAGDVVVNEILYSPLADARDNRPDQIAYVELFNRSPRVLDLNGYTRLNAPNERGQRDTVRLAYRPTRLDLGAYAVFFRTSGEADAASVLRAAFPVPSEAVLLPLSTTPSLPDDGDDVVIRTPGGLVLDSVAYRPSWQSRALVSGKGTALERLDPAGASNDPFNWSSSPAPEGGTPGAPNALSRGVEGAPETRGVRAATGIFSPDGDGVDDVAVFTFRLRAPSGTVRVRLYDANGRLVRTLGPSLAAQTGAIAWDGYDGDGRALPIGIYVALLDAVDEAGGQTEQYRGVVTLARRLR